MAKDRLKAEQLNECAPPSTETIDLTQQQPKDETEAEQLHLSRQSRVVAEANIMTEPCTLVSIRHTTLGRLARLFNINYTMNLVYDWVGSLARYPRYFELIDIPGKVIHPSEKIVNYPNTLHMFERSTPLSLEHDNEVSMSGFSTEVAGNNNGGHKAKSCVDETADNFGDDEIKRFFENEIDLVDSGIPQQHTIESNDIIKEAFIEYDGCKSFRIFKTIIVQRVPEKFWNILLKQSFDLVQHNLNIRFAGEAAADQGGPYREFLTLAMKHFPNLTNMFVGNSSQLCFSSHPESILEQNYFKLGQLVGVSVLTFGRGPGCLHPALVRAMFDIKQPEVIEDVDDGVIKNDLDNIDSQKYDCLFDLNIVPYGKSKEELKRSYLLSIVVMQKYAAIN